MRSFINKFGVPLAVVLIVFALIFAIVSRPKPAEQFGDPTFAWYVDEDTGEESIRPIAENIPPLTGSGGKDTVVQVYKCKAENEKEPITYYWVKYSDAAKKQAAASPDQDYALIEDILSHGKFIRSPEPGSKWFSARDPRAEGLLSIPEHSTGFPRRQAFPKKP
ncbi:MAG: hypothetical protein FWD53_03835 [Phycisphaerales bacterium]|nr:hypothetical protein [Phycisphaerales bacterium]